MLDRKILSFFERFFFSSRRRHTRYIGDWSSDVCSSDLADPLDRIVQRVDMRKLLRQQEALVRAHPSAECPQIGRASCRERVESSELCAIYRYYIDLTGC